MKWIASAATALTVLAAGAVAAPSAARPAVINCPRPITRLCDCASNGGATQTTSIVPGNSLCSGDTFELAADPWLSTGPDRITYLACISLDLNDVAHPAGPPYLPFRSRLQVNRSTDGGRSWSAPAVVVAGTGRLHDKPSLVPDPRRAGHAYIVWTEFLTPLGPPAEGISFSRTTDGGQTWSPPLHLETRPDHPTRPRELSRGEIHRRVAA